MSAGDHFYEVSSPPCAFIQFNSTETGSSSNATIESMTLFYQ